MFKAGNSVKNKYKRRPNTADFDLTYLNNNIIINSGKNLTSESLSFFNYQISYIHDIIKSSNLISARLPPYCVCVRIYPSKGNTNGQGQGQGYGKGYENSKDQGYGEGYGNRQGKGQGQSIVLIIKAYSKDILAHI